MLWKGSTTSKDEALIVLNKDNLNMQEFYAESLQRFVLAGAPLKDVSPEYSVEYIAEPFLYDVNPGQGLVYVTKREKQ